MGNGKPSWNLDGSTDPAIEPAVLLENAKANPEELVARFVGLHDQVGVLADIILALELRGDEPLGAIAVAGLRLESQAAELVELREALAHAREELAAMGKALQKAKGEIKVFKAALPPKPRKVGPMKGEADPDLKAAAFAGAPVEIVFSDGKGEIPGLAPTVVEGAAAWVRHVDRTLLKQHLTLNGPAPGTRPWSIAGVGLFVDGDQFAWSPFPEPLRIDPGSTVELRDAILV